MKVRFFFPIFFLVATAFAQSSSATAKRSFTFEDMMKLAALVRDGDDWVDQWTAAE